MRKLLTLTALLICLNSYSQEKTKSEYILSLTDTSFVKEVLITTETFRKAYTKEWMSNMTISNGMMFFRKKNIIHCWNIEQAIFIEKTEDRIIVKLPVKLVE